MVRLLPWIQSVVSSTKRSFKYNLQSGLPLVKTVAQFVKSGVKMRELASAKDEFQVSCPCCSAKSTWSLNLRWHVQSDLICPNCDENISKVILKAALDLQKTRLQKSLLICSLAILVLAAICLLLVYKFSNDLHQMPFFAVALFSVAAICCSLAVAVLIVLTKQLLFLNKRRDLLK